MITDAGSLIDFSGTQAPIDLPAAALSPILQQQTVASAAGSLTISARDSISILGNYEGAAGIGTTGIAAGGTLNVALLGGDAVSNGVITVQPGYLTGVLPADSGTAVLSTAQLAASGVDALSLSTDNQVQFTNGAQLNLARSVIIVAPAIGIASQSQVTVSAPYIALGAASSGDAAAATLPGTGTLSFKGSEIDLVGSLAFQGVANATLASSGEILLEGELLDTNNLGSLSIAGALTLQAARVVPTTDVDFTITASGGRSNSVSFQQSGSLSGVPLSVNGSLTVNADTITQAGTVYAPFGQLTFNAADTLIFAPGSITSVSGTSGGIAAVLPYGEVQNGTTWVYQVSPTEIIPALVTELPNRQISANGARVTIASGATVDVSGGGDAAGYVWTPGTGGTNDVLANTVTPGLYAVIPSMRGQTAPYDPMLWAGSNIVPNESVYLNAGSGLAAGIYPLLPARYGLLPGAYLVSVASGYQDLQPGVSNQASNGYPIVSGYFTYGNTGIGDTRTNGFLVEPGTYAQVLANYSSVNASTYFAGSAANQTTIPSSPLPADAGILLVSVQTEFDALGSVNGAAAKGGEGATIEIAAPQIEGRPQRSEREHARANSIGGSRH